MNNSGGKTKKNKTNKYKGRTHKQTNKQANKQTNMNKTWEQTKGTKQTKTNE